MTDPVRENQEDAFDCLRSLAGLRPEETKRIDTHANVIFIGAERVYKIKRAVKYPFLDYSTVARRFRFCASEIVLNRRTAPDLYLGILPLLRTPSGDLTAGEIVPDPDTNRPPPTQGNETVVDWAVVMRRFNDRFLFDRLAERDELTIDHLRDLGESIAAFHLSADPVHNDWRRICREVLTDNITEIAEADWLDHKRIGVHRTDCGRLFDKLTDRLSDRAVAGFVRQCHGDMHLQNVVLVDGKATLFDCIEFSDDFSQIDTLYDLAFLLMDLEHRGMADAGCRVLNRYMESTGDYGDVGLLPFYTALRAQVRAKIEVATVGFAKTTEAADEHRQMAASYFDLACCAVNRPKPRLIAVGGPSGSGKSTLAIAIAERMAGAYGPGVLVLRSDAIRKSLWNVPETAPLPAEAYATSVNVEVYDIMHKRAENALKQGMTVLLDATHTHPKSRNAASALARRLGVSFDGIWATAPRAVLIGRVTERTNDASDADAAIVRLQLKQDWGRIDWHEIDTSKRIDALNEVDSSVNEAVRILGLD